MLVAAVNRMQKDFTRIRDQMIASQARPVKLRIAASMAYLELTGRKRGAIPARDYFIAVSETARAQAQVADVYYVNEARRMVRLPAEEIEAGTFENGGDILRMPSGKVYRGLSMRRVDVMDGIEALRAGRGVKPQES